MVNNEQDLEEIDGVDYHKRRINTLICKLEYYLTEESDELSVFTREEYLRQYYFFRYLYEMLSDFQGYLGRMGVDSFPSKATLSFIGECVRDYKELNPDVEFEFYMGLGDE